MKCRLSVMITSDSTYINRLESSTLPAVYARARVCVCVCVKRLLNSFSLSLLCRDSRPRAIVETNEFGRRPWRVCLFTGSTRCAVKRRITVIHTRSLSMTRGSNVPHCPQKTNQSTNGYVHPSIKQMEDQKLSLRGGPFHSLERREEMRITEKIKKKK